MDIKRISIGAKDGVLSCCLLFPQLFEDISIGLEFLKSARFAATRPGLPSIKGTTVKILPECKTLKRTLKDNTNS